MAKGLYGLVGMVSLGGVVDVMKLSEGGCVEKERWVVKLRLWEFVRAMSPM